MNSSVSIQLIRSCHLSSLLASRKAANQITPQHLIEQTETEITISITNFLGTTVDGPSPIGTDFQLFVHQQLGDCMRRIELDPTTGGFTISVKKESDAIGSFDTHSLLLVSRKRIHLVIQFIRNHHQVCLFE
jgi:hypothetical protein